MTRPFALRSQFSAIFASVRACILVIAGTLLLAGCGAEFTRDNAITAVQTTGVNEVEATCIADSLIALGQLDAGNPQEERTEERRDAFVLASRRCINTEVLSGGPNNSQGSEASSEIFIAEPSAAVNGTSEYGPDAAGPNSYDLATGSGIAGDIGSDIQRKQRADDAVAVLVRQGRSESNAQCIVDVLGDVLVDAEAISLFSDPNFGLGLDSREANAIAACLGQQ